MGDSNPRDDAGCQQPDEHGGDEMNRTSMGTMRYLFFGVGLVGGVILLAAGQTLIGGLLVAMAAVRIVLLVSMQRGMRSSSSQARGVNGRRGGGRQMLQRLARMELAVAATAIGVAPDVLRHAVDDGRSIAALAADAGVPSDRVVDAVVRDANTKVDRAVADGRIAPDRASMLRNRLPNWAEHLVVQTPTMLAGAASPPA
jgi:hypothetical protein